MSKKENVDGLGRVGLEAFKNRSAADFPDFNPGWVDADHDGGIAYHAPWEDVFAGFPEHARRCAIALGATGPVHLRSIDASQFRSTGDVAYLVAYDKMRKGLRHLLEASIKTYDAEVFQVIADPASFYRIAGPTHPFLSGRELEFVHSRRVISTVFERDRIIPDVAKCLNRVGQTWVANHQDRDMLVYNGVAEEKVKVVPIPYFDNDPHLALGRLKEDRDFVKSPCAFYHIGKWEPRKEQRNILGAFMLAFRPGESKLFMKTSYQSPDFGSYPSSPNQAIKEWLSDPRVVKNGWNEATVNRNIYVIQSRLSANQMLQLHRQGDVYVTLSRGEGFDMPAFDAKLAGKLMVYTPSGGPQDFASLYDVKVEPMSSAPCHPFYGWSEDACYGDYSLWTAVEAMRVARDRFMSHPKPTFTTKRKERFGAKAVGEMMRDNLMEITQ